jgi:hypothetical protein
MKLRWEMELVFILTTTLQAEGSQQHALFAGGLVIAMLLMGLGLAATILAHVERRRALPTTYALPQGTAA